MPAGSVGKRSGPRGDSWYYRIDAGRDAQGKRQQKTKRGFSSEAAALAGMQDELVALREGRYIATSKETTGVFFDRWLSASALKWSPSTQRTKTLNLKRIRPYLADIPLQKVNAVTIQSAYSDMVKRLAPSTVRVTHTTLSQALSQAVKWKLLISNPCHDVELPRLVRHSITRWTAREARQFLLWAADDRWHALWRLLLDTGLRIGEALALRWQDIDLDAGRVHVERTVSRDQQGHNTISDYLKTTSSRRVVPLMPATIEALRTWRHGQLVRRMALGSYWHDGDLVFDAGDGQLLNPRRVQERLKLGCQMSGIPPLSPHGLRHTNATLLVMAGVAPKTVSERLGHRDVGFTLDRYVHPNEDDHRHATEALARLIEDSA